METFTHFEKGQVTLNGCTVELAKTVWKEHPQFTGVFLKNVISAEQTEGRCTCHLVRIDPGCAIGEHTHPTSIELHEVIAGSGRCATPTGEIIYRPGSIALMPQNAAHAVYASEDGLCLFAKFFLVE